ncbi:MAG: hypothetical protein KME42_13555 [Tildeniella nuda ZEHNDER 1965/U140]|jgi:hypothetical protein|nr:hypothetical protein [Tildeniella nuda ZEHNDER 1965/U140]
MSGVNNNVDTSESYDAQQAVEDIAGGDRKAPDANVEADYEASKQFSVSDIDRTSEGATAAEAVTSPQLEVSELEPSTLTEDSTGNPNDYKKMASDASSSTPNVGNVSDDLVQKALEKGSTGEQG